jgi:hypothetical protein
MFICTTGALAMEAQSISETVPRIFFVTSGDNKISSELQVPANVSGLLLVHFMRVYLMYYHQAVPIDLASDTWKLQWLEQGGVFHAKMPFGYGFWKVPMPFKPANIFAAHLNQCMLHRNHQIWSPKSSTRHLLP